MAGLAVDLTVIAQLLVLAKYINAADLGALQAWREVAAAEGIDVRDERTTSPLLDGSISTRLAIELHGRKREAQRDSQPLPIGSLFDEVSRAQSDLFSVGDGA